MFWDFEDRKNVFKMEVYLSFKQSNFEEYAGL